MTIQEVEEKFGEIQRDKNTKKWYLEVFHGKWFKGSRNEFCNSLERYYEILEELEKYNETLLDTYLKNNEICIKVKTNDGNEYNSSMRRFGKMIHAREKLNKAIEENGHKLLSTYINHDIQILVDFNCGHPAHYVLYDNYVGGHNKCRYCTHERTLEFKDDVYTLRPDLLKYFKNEKNTIGLALNSQKKFPCKCPICGLEKEYKVITLTKTGFACPNCRDGISYPEKMMGNILKDLNIPYETEVHFDWCNYVIDGTQYKGWYDFVIESMKTIIEMDGSFHYKESDFGSLELVQAKDKHKTELAKSNGYTIYRIDCNYPNQSSKYEYTKNSIIKTLSDVFDLSKIDWDEIAKRSDKHLLLDMCDMWNKGYATNYICKALDISNSMLIEYLNRGHNIGICSYTKEMSNKRNSYFKALNYNKYLKAIRNSELIGVFWDANIFSYRYVEKYNLPMSRSIITNVIRERSRGNNRTALEGTYFEPITKEEYISLLSTPNIITDDGVGNNPEYLVRVFPKYEHLKSA